MNPFPGLKNLLTFQSAPSERHEVPHRYEFHYEFPISLPPDKALTSADPKGFNQQEKV